MTTNYGPLKIIKGNIEYQRGANVSKKQKQCMKKNT